MVVGRASERIVHGFTLPWYQASCTNCDIFSCCYARKNLGFAQTRGLHETWRMIYATSLFCSRIHGWSEQAIYHCLWENKSYAMYWQFINIILDYYYYYHDSRKPWTSLHYFPGIIGTIHGYVICFLHQLSHRQSGSTAGKVDENALAVAPLENASIELQKSKILKRQFLKP